MKIKGVCMCVARITIFPFNWPINACLQATSETKNCKVFHAHQTQLKERNSSTREAKVLGLWKSG